jgi:alpha-ketoglutarate-dependent taurine dioxygenase
VVRSVIRPDNCGNTLFANTVAAYRELPADIKTLLDGSKATYCYLKTRNVSNGQAVEGLSEEQVKKALNCATHPVFTMHPETGERNIFVNPSHTTRIVNMEQSRSDELLQFIFEHTGELIFVFENLNRRFDSVRY